jgi:hypothetical protein
MFDVALSFRFIVLDLSWATIHAALEVLNLETVEEYAKRVYKYANDTNTSFHPTKSFLCSCVAHTMNRFTSGLKRHVKFVDCEHKTFAICCFSLLLNCTDLQSSRNVFKLTCQVFLSEFNDERVDQAR